MTKKKETKTTKRLKECEKIFNTASQQAMKMQLEDEDEITKEISLNPEEYYVAEVDPDSKLPAVPVEVFEMHEMKVDFILAKRTMHQLIEHGNRFMHQTFAMDLSDEHPQMVEAITKMSSTVAAQANMLLDMYKKVAEVEKLKRIEKGPQINVAGSINTQVINASNSDLLKKIMTNNQ